MPGSVKGEGRGQGTAGVADAAAEAATGAVVPRSTSQAESQGTRGPGWGSDMQQTNKHGYYSAKKYARPSVQKPLSDCRHDMDISFQSILLFAVVSAVYFLSPGGVGKPALALADVRDPAAAAAFRGKTARSLGLFVAAVVCSQWALNLAYLMAKCGGSLDANLGGASLYTLVPWLFLFGTMVAALFVFPGLKGAFSDVFGYFVVAGRANDLLSSYLLNAEEGSALDRSTADAVAKLSGNTSILVNKWTPENFVSMWALLAPLMKPEVRGSEEAQQKLLHLVAQKDSVGEYMWYLYTAVLVSSIVTYNLATRGCVKTAAQIRAGRDAYLKQQEQQAQAQQAQQANAVTYVA